MNYSITYSRCYVLGGLQFQLNSKQFGNKHGPSNSKQLQAIPSKIRLGFRDLTLLNFHVELNEMCCSDRCLIFRFRVDSTGGQVLASMSQRLRGGNLCQQENPPRSMSPPGQVFHLSVYSDRRTRWVSVMAPRTPSKSHDIVIWYPLLSFSL